MTTKEKFLNVKTYEEFDMRRSEFSNMDINDSEIAEHFNSLFPTLDNSYYEKGIIVDVNK